MALATTGLGTRAAEDQDASGAPTPAREDSVTPQRPSLSFNTLTTAAGGFELEAGGRVSQSSSSVPLLFKLGMTEKTELDFALDAIRRADLETGAVTSQGDLVLGMRSRLAGRRGGPSLALGGFLKVPTAREDVGTGELDARVTGIMSVPVGSMSVDGNLALAALGREGGARVGQVEAIATLNLPVWRGSSPFVELAGQRTATEGSGGFFDAGVLFAASRRTAVDGAAGFGWRDGYPDWSVTLGWTILLKERTGGSGQVARLENNRERDR